MVAKEQVVPLFRQVLANVLAPGFGVLWCLIERRNDVAVHASWHMRHGGVDRRGNGGVSIVRVQRHDADLGNTAVVQHLQAISDRGLAVAHAQGHRRTEAFV